MKQKDLFWRLTCLGLFSLTVMACSSPASPTPDRIATRVEEEKGIAATLTASAPTKTSTETATATPIPPTFTPTPFPPTATSTPSLGPEAGHWSGGPDVSFMVTNDGRIANFKMMFKHGVGNLGTTSYCTIERNEITFASDQTFKIQDSFEKNENVDALIKLASKFDEPTPVPTLTGSTITYEGMMVNGKFTDAKRITGDYRALLCQGTLTLPSSKGTWSAKWVSPLAAGEGQASATGNIMGRIYRSDTDKSIAQVNVILSDGTLRPGQGIVAELTTNEQGNYEFNNLKPGRYYLGAKLTAKSKTDLPCQKNTVIPGGDAYTTVVGTETATGLAALLVTGVERGKFDLKGGESLRKDIDMYCK